MTRRSCSIRATIAPTPIAARSAGSREPRQIAGRSQQGTRPQSELPDLARLSGRDVAAHGRSRPCARRFQRGAAHPADLRHRLYGPCPHLRKQRRGGECPRRLPEGVAPIGGHRCVAGAARAADRAPAARRHRSGRAETQGGGRRWRQIRRSITAAASRSSSAIPDTARWRRCPMRRRIPTRSPRRCAIPASRS